MSSAPPEKDRSREKVPHLKLVTEAHSSGVPTVTAVPDLYRALLYSPNSASSDSYEAGDRGETLYFDTLPENVVINTMAPAQIEMIRPFTVVVCPYEDEFKASFYDANLSTFGDTRNEAIWNLIDLIASTFQMLLRHEESRLGPGPARQLQVLSIFLRKTA